jgi:putative peptidoglycan lipid II flippase
VTSDGRLARTSAVIGAGTLLSRITGFLRVSALASLGFARLTDVYNLANSTPNIVYELLLGGILTATLVPLFVQSNERDEPDATDAIVTVTFVLLAIGTVVGVLLAPWIIATYVNLADVQGAGEAAQRTLATELLRWFMPQMLFYGITALATALLNARRRFAAAAFAPALNNVVVIAMLLAVGRASSAPPTVQSVLDDPVLVLLLGLGTTAGVVAMALVLLPAVRRAGVRIRWRFAPRHPAVRHLARLSGWTVGYVAANQVAFLVVLVLAYRAQADVSIYLAAFTFFQLPHGLLAVSVMTALGPELASHHVAGDRDGLRADFGRGMGLLVILMIPAAVALAILAGPAITALLDHGDFTSASAAVTARTLRAFAVGLVPFSVYLFVIRTFTSMQDTRTPFVLNVIENGTNVATAFALYAWLGVEGLAWSWTIAYGVGAVTALFALRRRLVRLDGRRLGATTLKVSLAAAPAGVAAAAVAVPIGWDTPPRAALALVAGGVAGGVVFTGLLALLGISLADRLRSTVRRRATPDELPA